MKFTATTAVIALAIGVGAQQQAPAYGQCGGQGWSGPTTCVSGYVCTLSNQWFSQCLPGTGPPVTTTQPPATTPPPSTTQPPVTQPPTTTTSPPYTPPPSTTTSGPAPTGSQIRTVTNPVYHYYLQSNGGKPQLGPESSSGKFTINGTISLNLAGGSKLYLNLNSTATTSYKPLTLDATATTTNWGLEGDTIIIKSPRQLNFLACNGNTTTFYDVFLQTGNDSPAGRTCTMVTMHLPCLC